MRINLFDFKTTEIIKLDNNLYTIREYEWETVIRRISNEGLLHILTISDNGYYLFNNGSISRTVDFILYLKNEHGISNSNLLPDELLNKLIMTELQK